MEYFPARPVWIPEGMCYVCWQMNMIPDTPSAVSLFVLGYSTKLQNCFHPAREDVLHTVLTNHIWCCHIAILHLFCPQNMLVRSWFYVFSYLYLHSTASPTLFFWYFWVMLTSFPCSVPFSPVLRVKIHHRCRWGSYATQQLGQTVPDSSRYLIYDRKGGSRM